MRELRTPGWLVRHAVAVLLVLGFLGLGWWQVRRAAEGNLLSYGYAVEWPVFAAFVIFVWFKEVQAARRGRGGPADHAGRTPDRAGPEGSAGGSSAPPGSPVPPARSSTAAEAGGTLADLGRPRPPVIRPRGSGVAAPGARRGQRVPVAAAGPAGDDADDPLLVAYNRYLAWLNANPQASPSDYPGENRRDINGGDR